jgi:putative holliday junction resolvase
MRIAALDLGDVWIGIAIADPLGITARPYKTIKAAELQTTIMQLIDQDQVSSIVVGNPQTLRGTESAQTKKVHEQCEQLQNKFPTISWILWDERLTSKEAARIHKATDKKEKLQQHAVAAAIILRSYLDHLAWKKEHAE